MSQYTLIEYGTGPNEITGFSWSFASQVYPANLHKSVCIQKQSPT